MPAHARVNGGDSHAAGRGRQRLKIAGLGYAHARHGIDADADRVRAAVVVLKHIAVEFALTLPGMHLKNRRIDLLLQADSTLLENASIAYAAARHGVDADVGMAREGMAMLCQAAVDFFESLPKEDQSKRSADPRLQIGNGA